MKIPVCWWLFSSSRVANIVERKEFVQIFCLLLVWKGNSFVFLGPIKINICETVRKGNELLKGPWPTQFLSNEPDQLFGVAIDSVSIGRSASRVREEYKIVESLHAKEEKNNNHSISEPAENTSLRWNRGRPRSFSSMILFSCCEVLKVNPRLSAA